MKATQGHISHLANITTASYKQVFFDDFLGNSLDSAWTKGIWFEQSVAPDANYQVSNSELTLKWTRGQKANDTSISSVQTFRYGYFSVRMKWPVGVVGAWPAFWACPIQAKQGAQETGEIDFFEGEGISTKTFFGTIHDWMKQTDIQNNANANAYPLSPNNNFADYHLYGFLWTPTSMTWFYDGVPMNTVTPYPIFAQQDYFLILGSQVGAAWRLGNMTGVTANELDVVIDSVGVWQLE